MAKHRQLGTWILSFHKCKNTNAVCMFLGCMKTLLCNTKFKLKKALMKQQKKKGGKE